MGYVGSLAIGAASDPDVDCTPRFYYVMASLTIASAVAFVWNSLAQCGLLASPIGRSIGALPEGLAPLSLKRMIAGRIL
jgi:hypothetical protein